jgi:hypothetical protein
MPVGIPDHVGVDPVQICDSHADSTGASSARREWENDSTPAFDAHYALIIGAAPMDASEAICW